MHPEKTERGFTILLAALTAALVLAVGISVFSVAQKQLILSSISRGSQVAFYAADTAAECALFHDIRNGVFDVVTPSSPITCANNTNIVVSHSSLALYATGGVDFTFQFEPNGYCANVTVHVQSTHPRTSIHADGFNTSCGDLGLTSRTLQRSVELTY